MSFHRYKMKKHNHWYDLQAMAAGIFLYLILEDINLKYQFIDNDIFRLGMRILATVIFIIYVVKFNKEEK